MTKKITFIVLLILIPLPVFASFIGYGEFLGELYLLFIPLVTLVVGNVLALAATGLAWLFPGKAQKTGCVGTFFLGVSVIAWVVSFILNVIIRGQLLIFSAVLLSVTALLMVFSYKTLLRFSENDARKDFESPGLK